MECVLDAKAALGEGPVWDPDAGCLYFVDIERGLVHRYDPDTQASRSHQVDAMVGAVALTVSGDLLLAVRDGFARLDPDSGRVRRIACVEADRPDLRMNDGACDPAGRFWAGTMAIDERHGAGALYRLDRTAGCTGWSTMSPSRTASTGATMAASCTTSTPRRSPSTSSTSTSRPARSRTGDRWRASRARMDRPTVSPSTPTDTSGWRSGRAAPCTATRRMAGSIAS